MLSDIDSYCTYEEQEHTDSAITSEYLNNDVTYFIQNNSANHVGQEVKESDL